MGGAASESTGGGRRGQPASTSKPTPKRTAAAGRPWRPWRRRRACSALLKVWRGAVGGCQSIDPSIVHQVCDASPHACSLIDRRRRHHHSFHRTCLPTHPWGRRRTTGEGRRWRSPEAPRGPGWRVSAWLGWLAGWTGGLGAWNDDEARRSSKADRLSRSLPPDVVGLGLLCGHRSRQR